MQLPVLLLAAAAGTAAAPDWSQYVNPLIGGAGPTRDTACKFTIPSLPALILTKADGGGDIFVGGAVPFSTAKVGIDTYEANVEDATLNGGWTPDGKVTAISASLST